MVAIMRRGSLGVERRGQTIDAVFAHTGRRSSMSSITRMEFGDEATAWHIASIFCRISTSEAEVRRGMSRERSLADRRDDGAVPLEMRVRGGRSELSCPRRARRGGARCCLFCG